MLSINKSFIYGICFASITWIVSLYLYIRLTENEYMTIKSSTENNRMKKFFAEQLRTEVLRKSNDSEERELNELGLIRTIEEQDKKDLGYKVHAYNTLISDRIGDFRTIPDTRNQLCKNISYPNDLPSASIIICFYNEHFSTLIRTITSIIRRTPSHLLHDIILVDDFSNLDDLKENLEIKLKTIDSRIKLIRTQKREGLIRARLYGARNSTGEVIIFLDSHVEVNVGWIEPLLSNIKENRKNVAIPIIDIINADTFAYSSSPLVRGGFNWGLHFKWDNLPKGTLNKSSDFVKPIKSPTMAGGLFAIDRKYFVEVGEYDEGMNIWGGENLEISFRIWMCGGQLHIIPCSRVGHVFRHRRPYGSPNGEDTMLYNSLRLANVWMDDYKDFFLKQRTDAKNLDYGDISSRIELRKRLRCQDFDWYLKNIYPEQTFPTDNKEVIKKKYSALERDKFQPWNLKKRNYINQFQIRLSNSSYCLQSKDDLRSKGSRLILQKCTKSKSQIWYETDKNELVLGKLFCLQAGKYAPILYKCHEMGSDQEWKHIGAKNSPIYNTAAGTCLGAEEKRRGAGIILKLCSQKDLIGWDLINS